MRHSFVRRKNKTVSGDVRPRNRTPGKRLVKPSFFETPWRRCWGGTRSVD